MTHSPSFQSIVITRTYDGQYCIDLGGSWYSDEHCALSTERSDAGIWIRNQSNQPLHMDHSQFSQRAGRFLETGVMPFATCTCREGRLLSVFSGRRDLLEPRILTSFYPFSAICRSKVRSRWAGLDFIHTSRFSTPSLRVSWETLSHLKIACLCWRVEGNVDMQ